MKTANPWTRRVVYVTSVDLVDNPRAHAIQMMKNGRAWHRLADDFELIANLSWDHWCRLSETSLAHYYGLTAPVPVTAYPLQHWEGSANPFLATLYYRLTAWRCRRRGVTLAYCRSYEAAHWLTRQGIPTIMESHGLPQNQQHRQNLPTLCQRASFAALVTITPPLESLFRQQGVAAEKILVLPDGVDLERFTAPMAQPLAKQWAGVSPERPLAVYTGHLYAGRGIEEILHAAARLEQVQFLLVGGLPNDVAQWQQRIDRQRLDNVRLTGHVTNGLLPRYLWAADVLLMPYSTRCPTVDWMSPMKMFEYMAAGRPILASDLPAVRLVLQHGHNGWLVPPDHGDGLARGIAELLAQPERGQRLARQARQDVVPYDWEQRVLKIIDFLPHRPTP